MNARGTSLNCNALKKIKLFTLLLTAMLAGINSGARNGQPEEYKIQIALLIDVSGSMSGLILQAKGQIWRMVNDLTKAEKNNMKPIVQLSLGTYGNADFQNNGFFKLYTPLTTDVDLVSESLFQLDTGGDQEYCGHAIQYALDSLKWSKNPGDLKIIFIAGNEPFNQGATDYREACKNAAMKNVIVNTIYCGGRTEGQLGAWDIGAKIAHGNFMCINQDTVVRFGETFWDKKIIELNNWFNDTYEPYGSEGELCLQRQLKQDENALLLGNDFMRERILFKSSDAYENSHWDLVDAYRRDSTILGKIPINELPFNLQDLTLGEMRLYLDLRIKQRELCKETIGMYSSKALEFLLIDSNVNNSTTTLNSTIISVVRDQASQNGFNFRNDQGK
jgi:von Willebrand factor type A domain